MPANEQTWRDTKLMHVVFGVSSVVMLITTVWMMADDHNRPWKDIQRTFRDLPDLRGHLPMLDGVRGLAILMVLALYFLGTVPPSNWAKHAVFVLARYGSYGVELFLVLSGFLITGIL